MKLHQRISTILVIIQVFLALTFARPFSKVDTDHKRNASIDHPLKLNRRDLYAPVETSVGCQKCKSSLHFSNPAASKFTVGNTIPTLSLRTKNSWAGSIPIKPGKDTFFYFYLWGNDGINPADEIVIFLNGGPGCSSLFGMTTETGPFLYTDKRKGPIVNEYSWTKEATILYVELPIGVGFTKGQFINTNEEILAQQFASFLENFFIIFSELKGKKVYIAAESYAAVYSSYIMDLLYRTGNKYNLQGGMMISGLFSNRVAQLDLVAYDFAVTWANTLRLTPDDIAAVRKASDLCQYTGYTQKNLVYPPVGRLPPFRLDGCKTSYTLFNRSVEKNKEFNPCECGSKEVYSHLTDEVISLDRVTIPDPALHSPLGNPYAPVQASNFFDNPDLQAYIHAPPEKWNQCVRAVFPHGDTSLPPDEFPSFAHSILAGAIEKSPAGLMILSGRQDAMVITDGTSLILQNLTWNNLQGFQ